MYTPDRQNPRKTKDGCDPPKPVRQRKPDGKENYHFGPGDDVPEFTNYTVLDRVNGAMNAVMKALNDAGGTPLPAIPAMPIPYPVPIPVGIP